MDMLKHSHELPTILGPGASSNHGRPAFAPAIVRRSTVLESHIHVSL